MEYEHNNSPTFKKVGCRKLLCDMYDHISKGKLILILLIALTFSILLHLCANICNNVEMYISVSLTLMGFSLAAFAILIGSKEIMDKINVQYNETGSKYRSRCRKNTKPKPVETMFADLVLGLIVQGVSILWYIVINNFHCVCNLIETISLALVLIEILWSIHIIIHIYTLRTFYHYNHNNTINSDNEN